MKRRLTDQQHRRIQSAKKVKEKEWTTMGVEDRQQAGLVVSHFGNMLEVESNNLRFRCHARQNLGQIVVGDRVIFCSAIDGEGDAHLGLVIARQERSSVLIRPDVYKQYKEIAANIDQMFITMAAEPEVIPYFIDKYLVAAELQKIRPILLFNKADLLTPEAFSRTVLLMESYRKIGYQALSVSVRGDLQELREWAKGKVSIFVGPSGVGKSALTNALLGSQRALVGEMSVQNQKGCHTTTRSCLYHLPSDLSDLALMTEPGTAGSIIDSPGIREFGLWDISPAQAALGFIEFRDFLGRCKFRDCTHISTPGCALEAALREQKISAARISSFYRLLGEIEKNN
jgi:ribosome biogenesis GTPase / thiamine phosphate phosphatase